jgi:LAGLIDADG endonuclease
MLRYSLYSDNWIREENSDSIAPYRSDNSTAADNQQERLIKIGWITGYVDGEGCFSISLIRQPHRSNRRGYRTGFQVAHEFAVTQGASSVDSLHLLVKFFGVGCVYINKRYDNHKEHMYRYCVRARKDLVETVIPFFDQYLLRTSKQDNFLKFAECMRLMETGVHLTTSGLIKIVEIAETMNHKKPRNEIIRILRDYTPNADAKSVKI